MLVFLMAAATRLSILSSTTEQRHAGMVQDTVGFWWPAATCRVLVAGEDAGSSYWIGVVLRPLPPLVTCKTRTSRMRLLMRLPVT
jgi:hypothetical protein